MTDGPDSVGSTESAPELEVQEQQPTVQIAANAPIKMQILEKDAKVIKEFECSRNVTVLLPALQDAIVSLKDTHDVEDLRVTGVLMGKDPETGADAELALYDGPAAKVLMILRLRSVSPEEAMVASRGFFGDMLDMVDIKAVLLTAVFEEGQGSYVMLNKTVEVEPEHMFRLVATTLMQLDKFKEQMQEAGVAMPGGDGAIITPGQAGYQQPLGGMRSPRA